MTKNEAQLKDDYGVKVGQILGKDVHGNPDTLSNGKPIQLIWDYENDRFNVSSDTVPNADQVLNMPLVTPTGDFEVDENYALQYINVGHEQDPKYALKFVKVT